MYIPRASKGISVHLTQHPKHHTCPQVQYQLAPKVLAREMTTQLWRSSLQYPVLLSPMALPIALHPAGTQMRTASGLMSQSIQLSKY